MHIQNLKAGEDAAGGRFGCNYSRFPVEAGALSIAERLQCIRDRERQAGECLALNLTLRLGRKKADVDAIGGMLIASFRQNRCQIGLRRGETWLEQRPVERGASETRRRTLPSARRSGSLTAMRTLRSGCCQGRRVASTSIVSPA